MTELVKLRSSKAGLYIAIQSLLNRAKFAPLLLGPPGIGKSEASQQSMQILTYAILKHVKEQNIPVNRNEIKSTLVLLQYELKVRLSKPEEQDEKSLALYRLVNSILQKFDESCTEIERFIKWAVQNFATKCDGWEECRQFYHYAVTTSPEQFSELVSTFSSALTRKYLAVKLRWETAEDPFMLFDDSVPVELYRHSWLFVSFNVSSVPPSSVIGVPMLSVQGTATWPPKWAIALRTAHIGLLNLDEVTNRMPEALQSAIYNIVLNKQVGNYRFNKPVVGTGNTKSSSSLVTTLPGPLLTGRFAPLLTEVPSVEDWIRYMNRVYRNRWFEPIGTMLNMFSRYGTLYKILNEDASSAELLSRIVSKLVGDEFGDIYMVVHPDEFSRIIPGETPAFPTPRAWTQVAVQVKKLADALVNAKDVEDRKFIREQIYYTVASVTGLNNIARILSLVAIDPKILTMDINALLSELERSTVIIDSIADSVQKFLGGDMGDDVLVAIAQLLILLSRLETYAKLSESARSRVLKVISAVLQKYSGATDLGKLVIYYFFTALKKELE